MPDHRTTPLHERHAALGAAFTDFGGWLMPVRYGSDLAEHRLVREAAGLFDISHMAEFVVAGTGAGEFLDYALAGRVSTLAANKAKYSLVLAEDGGIVDDVIVYRLAADRYVIIANAGNRAAVDGAFGSALDTFSPSPQAPAEGSFALVAGTATVEVDDVSDDSALLAVQGPLARAVLEAVEPLVTTTPAEKLGDAGSEWALSDVKYYSARTATFEGTPVLIARTGYTGEDGFELLIAADRAGDLWDALLEAGTPLGLAPAGLAARDTLRLEAGMPLYGHELGRSIRPAQAGLGRVVAADKDDFVGKVGVDPAPGAPVLVGLVSDGKRAGRAGYPVYRGEDLVGEITSGALSPTLGRPIAMAFVAPDAAAPDTALTIDVRGTRIPTTVTALPFYRRTT